MKRASQLSGGFTLIEMLTTIAVIALLTSLLVPAAFKAKNAARSAACASNMRQFGLSFQMYAGDNLNSVLPNKDGSDVPLGESWVQGWLGLPGPDCTNTLYLRQSLLGPYLSQVRLWQCPSAKDVTIGGITQARVRTLSLNCFMGSPVKSPAARSYRRLSDITDPSPAETLTFIEEREDTINDGSFAMQWNFREDRPNAWLLRDKPATRHENGANLVFADGHVERHGWQDSRTLKAPRNDAEMPRNRDILWLQQHATSRK